MTLIAQAKVLVQLSRPDEALTLMTPELLNNQENVDFLQVYGEVLLETNNLEEAYAILQKSCVMDQTAQLGVEKFLYMGQIIGGADGIEYLNIGLNRLHEQLITLNESNQFPPEINELIETYNGKDGARNYLIRKLNQGIFAKIEIWMTDLCMEPNAESECNELIEFSLSIDNTNPEAYSLLSSIRISQQNIEEAKEALKKSWELFQVRKTNLEDAKDEAKEEAPEDVSMDYIELIQPLLTVSKFAIELELYDLSISVASNVQDINEDILDCYYVEALAYLFKAKSLLVPVDKQQQEDYRDIETKQVVASLETQPEIKSLVDECKVALTNGYKIINSGSEVEMDPQVVEQVNQLLKELGGPKMDQLMPAKINDDDGDWEDEIASGDEDNE